ncbi:MAG TPA: M20/M25/M40 family metallo-hydrolase [Candidatus Acidoferrales bacterium]|nr:M20/M25/M40 family metallo-hydrolase [Candidatus Acidoferrales bacterium]
MDSELARAILSQVREDEIVPMATDLVNTPSPTGEELEMGRSMRRIFEETGFRVTCQEIEPGRSNVVGLWEGAGAGKSLMFNGHMDTSNSGAEPFLTGIGYKPKAVIRGGMLYGLGIYNMKGALVCYVQAVRALQRAGVRLSGDLLIAAVVGEIEKTQWGDEYVGRQFRGYGAGTHYLVNHGAAPDMCILGEPTDMQLVLGHYGPLWVRISAHGAYRHTAFTRGHEEESSIRRLHHVLGAIYEWIPVWQKRAAYAGEPGIVNVGCIQGGHPWRASRSPQRADAFLDVRVPPPMPMAEARRAIAELVAELRRRFPDFGLEWEVYVTVPGAEIAEDHDLVRAVDAAHRHVMGQPPARTTVAWSSDASVMSRYGIPTLNYGPSSGPRDAEGEKVAIATLMNVSKVYALAAAEICGVSR